MSFITIEPASQFGRERLVNRVRCRATGGCVAFVLSRDVADRIGLVPNGRATVAVGVGTHTGQIAILPAKEGDTNSYRVSPAGGNPQSCSLQVAFGPRHLGWSRKVEIKSMDVEFAAIKGQVIITLPVLSQTEQPTRRIPISTNSHATA